MGNTTAKHQSSRDRPKKNVHWKSAETPSPPGKPILAPTAESRPDVVGLRWERPRTDGGSPLYGYLIEHRRTGSPHWVRSTPALILYPEVELSGLEPGWRYQFRVTAENAVGLSEFSELSDPLTVTLQRNAIAPPRFVNELPDTIGIENEKVEFNVAIVGEPPPIINWFKDGFEVFSSRRTKILNENDSSTLIIHQTALTDEGEIKCTATNRAGHVVTKAQLKIEAPPKIRLPRQYEEGLLIEADEIIRLKVGLAGRPPPTVVWCHNGEVVSSSDRYELLTNDKNSTLKISNAKRSDRGEYNLRAINKLGEDNVSFLVTVTDRPSVPGKVAIMMSIGKSVTLSWTAPEDDGGCKIGTYVVEYFRIGWNVWLKAVSTRQLTATLNDLIEGSEYKFRVKAESPYGMSDPSVESDALFIPDPKRGITKPNQTDETNDHADKLNSRNAPPSPSQPAAQPKKRHPSPSPRRSSNEEKPIKVDKQEQTISTTKKPRTPPELYDTDIIAREMSYGTTHDFVNKRLEYKKELSKTDEQILKEMTYDTSNDTYNPRGKLKATQSNTSENNNIRSILKERSPIIMVTSNTNEQFLSYEKKYDENKKNTTQQKSNRVEFVNLNTNKSNSYNNSNSNNNNNNESEKSELQHQQQRKQQQEQQQQQQNYRKVEEENHDELHTSSEFVLVLYDDKKSGNKDEMSLDEEFDSILPPQLSSSTPELGLEMPEAPLLRRCVSSTELLYEKAMQRFYKAVQFEESEKNSKQQSIDNHLHHDSTRKRYGSMESDRISVERRDSLKKKLSGDIFNFSKKIEDMEQRAIHASKTVQSSTEVEEQPAENEMALRTQDSIEEYEEVVEEDDDERDLKKEILDSQRKLSVPRRLTPDSSVEYEDDYTDSTASSAASLSSMDSMEKFKSVIRTISSPDKQTNSEESELDTYHPMEQRILSSNTKMIIDNPIADPVILSKDDHTEDNYEDDDTLADEDMPSDNEANAEIERNIQSNKSFNEEYQKSETYARHEARALSPYRIPEPNQATIALTIPLPMPSPDFVPKPILKKPSSPPPLPSSKTTEKKQKKTKQNKTERKGILQLFKKTPSTGNLTTSQEKLKAATEEGSKTETKMSTQALAKKLTIERRQNSLEENKVAIDHYSDIVKEVGSIRKPKVPIYLSSEELKKAAEQEAQENALAITSNNNLQSTSSTDKPKINVSTPPKTNDNILRPVVKLKETDSRSIFAIKLSKDPKKMIHEPEFRPIEQIPLASNLSRSPTPPLQKEMPDGKNIEKPDAPYIDDAQTTEKSRTSRPTDIKKIGGKKRTPSGTRSRSSSALRGKTIATDATEKPTTAKRDLSKTRVKSESRSPSGRNRRPLHVAKIKLKDENDITPMSMSPEPRSHTPEEILDEAEKKVKSTMQYMTDVAMLIVACWIYVFKDARLALPILALMVYRQAGSALKDKLPKWMKRKSE